jgi:hypothetical protein
VRDSWRGRLGGVAEAFVSIYSYIAPKNLGADDKLHDFLAKISFARWIHK